MIYSLKSALLLALLYGGFAVLLRRMTFHRFNRMMLLAILVLSLVIPAIHINLKSPSALLILEDVPTFHMEERSLDSFISASNGQQSVKINAKEAYGNKAASSTTDWSKASNAVYLTGLMAFLLLLLWRVCQLVLSLRGGLRSSDGQGNTIIVKKGEFAPYSFMHHIVINISDYEHHRKAIITHEKAHARLHHSWDVLLVEVVQAVQWFNPFVWLLGCQLKAIHEYEADEAVILQGIDAKQYQQLLVVKAVGNRLQPFANTLNRGSLKQRIQMMQQTKSSRWQMLRAAFVLPVAILALYANATPAAPEPSCTQKVVEVPYDEAEVKPLVEYRAHQKVAKHYRDYYRVNLGKGVWIDDGGRGYIEECYFRYGWDNTHNQTEMQLNGVPFDQNSLPQLTSHDLKKIEIKKMEQPVIEGEAHGTDLSIESKHTIVNLITTPITIPTEVKGNAPREITLLLPGKGNLYVKNAKATPGDWVHCSRTSWEKTPYNYSVRDEFKYSLDKPDFKCYIYASTRTSERDISRAEALMQEMGITNYEVVRNLPPMR